MQTIRDKTLGEIVIRRHPHTKGMKATVRTDGRLGITIGRYTPLLAVRHMLQANRSEIIQLLRNTDRKIYRVGEMVGKSHHIISKPGDTLRVQRSKQMIIVTLPPTLDIESDSVQKLLRPIVIAALRKEAKAYLPHRLARLSELHDLPYSSLRFSHAGSRWGSCSTNGTISLNIGLMSLPHHLIDYVLLHELSHTKHMDHSPRFWSLLEVLDPRAKDHRRELRAYSPHV